MQMSKLYLRKLKLSEFRAFSDLELELPPKPGVLIISGTNGLGKSSLFDAIEWCLTGEIDRFSSAKRSASSESYLRRWGAKGKETSVELNFEGQPTLSRTLDDEGGEVEAAKQILISPNWGHEVKNLHSYLLLTHFLGQSSSSRMTHRDPKNRWELLKGPAQSDWADNIAKAMHGHGGSGMARAYERAAADFEEYAKDLEQLLSLERQQFEEVSAEGSFDEKRTVLECQSIISDVIAALAALGDAKRVAPSLGDVNDALEKAQEFVDHSNETIERRKKVLISAAQTFKSIEQEKLQVANNQVKIEGFETQLKELELGRSKIESSIKTFGDAEKGIGNEVTALKEKIAKLQKIFTLNSELSAWAIKHEDLIKQIIKTEDEQRRYNESIKDAERRRYLAQKVQTRLTRYLEELSKEIERQQTLRNLAVLSDQRHQAGNAISIMVAAYPDLSVKIESSRAAEANAKNEEIRAIAELGKMKAAINAVEAAVGTIAANLAKDSCICPVCDTNFQTPGELLAKASLAAKRLAPSISHFEAGAAKAREVRVNAEQTTERLLAVEKELNLKKKGLEGIEHNYAKLQKLLPAGIDTNIPISEHLEKSKNRIEQLEFLKKRQERWKASPTIGTESSAREIWARLVADRNEVTGLLSRLNESKNLMVLSKAGLDQENFSLSIYLGVGGTDKVQIEEALSAANNRLVAQEADLAKVKEQIGAQDHLLKDLKVKISELAANKMSCESAIKSSTNSLVRETERWISYSLGSEISERILQHSENLMMRVEQGISSTSNKLEEARRRFSLSLKQSAYKQTIEQLKELLELPVTADREEIVKRATDQQSQLFSKARKYNRAKSIAQSGYYAITDKVEHFNRQFLQPLNDLMVKLNKAILTEPEIGLDLSYDRQGVKQLARGSSNAPDFVKTLDPTLVHSEGQMAALAVSMLCAASLSFQWSRWPALIMDDPLQHNDVVHVSAFTDMIRNLVNEKKYQVFLSTHDLTQANFIERKCKAGNVPCTVVHLLGSGDMGTEFRVELSKVASH